MRSLKSVAALEKFGRTRLSEHFFMRDFLYSEVGNFYGVPNIPDDPDLAIAVGESICKELLEPLQQAWGHLNLRSAYRSATLNQFCNEKNLNCASNAKNAAGHIWDLRDAHGQIGGTVCLIVNSYIPYYEATQRFEPLAWWIHDHLPYSSMYFFPQYCAFNLAWHETPKRTIDSYVTPKGRLTAPGWDNHAGDHSHLYPATVPFPLPDSDRTPEAAAPFTVEQYLAALRQLWPEFSQGYRRMLQAQIAAPDLTLTASELAEAAGYNSFRAVNLHYAKLGERINTAIAPDAPERWTGAIASSYYKHPRWYWVLYPECAQALVTLINDL